MKVIAERNAERIPDPKSTGESVATLERGYAAKGYGELKAQVAARVVAAVEPFQRRMAELGKAANQ